MSFNGKYYDNVQLTSIGENKEHEWSHNCLRIAMNVMCTQIPEKKGIKLFKERTVVSIVKEYTQLDGMHVVGPENPDVISLKQNKESVRALKLIKGKQCSKN